MIPVRPAPTALPLLLAAALSACDPAEPPVATTIEVTPSQVSFTAVGDTEQLQARVLDQYGRAMTDVNFRWSILNPGVAKVGIGSGMVASAGNGTTTIGAWAGRVSGLAKVTVLQEARAMEKARGDGQVGYPHEPLPVSPAVLVVDANGNPAEDITVAFEVTSGGGTVSHTSVVTQLDGIAETAWKLGPDPVHTLTASTGAPAIATAGGRLGPSPRDRGLQRRPAPPDPPRGDGTLQEARRGGAAGTHAGTGGRSRGGPAEDPGCEERNAQAPMSSRTTSGA